MSVNNNNNRPQETIMLPTITATATLPVFLAGKKLIVRSLKFLSTSRQGKSGATYATLQFQKLVGAVATDVGDSFNTKDTNFPIGKRVDIDGATGMVLQKNESLQLKITTVIAQRSAIGWKGNVVGIDYAVIGN